MKIYIILFIIITASIVGAVTLNNREDMFSAFSTYKATRENNINKLTTSINYTDDLICFIDYDTENINCETCFSFKIDNKEKNICITTPENITRNELDIRIKDEVKNIIKMIYPEEKYKYVKMNIKDEVIN